MGGGKNASGKGYVADDPPKGRAEDCDDSSDEDEEMDGDSDDDYAAFGFEAEKAAGQSGPAGACEDDDGMALSPFGPETFPTAAACWAHASQCYGFSLAKLREEIGSEVWTDYHRIKLVNYLRSLGPEQARREAPTLTAKSTIWTEDKWLQPVKDDDCLLFDDDEDEDIAMAAGQDCNVVGQGHPGDAGSSDPAALAEENARLRAELASTHRLLAAFAEEDKPMERETDDDDAEFGLDAEKDEAPGGAAGEDEDSGMVLSPFGPETFASAAACWEHAAQCHGFILARLREEVGRERWTDFHRIKLVNYLRHIGPERARTEARELNAESAIWAEDKWLQPVKEDDVLLFDDDDEDFEMAMEGGEAGNGTGAGSAMDPTGSSCGPTNADPAALAEENARLREKLASTRRLLAAYADEDVKRPAAKSGANEDESSDDEVVWKGKGPDPRSFEHVVLPQ